MNNKISIVKTFTSITAKVQNPLISVRLVFEKTDIKAKININNIDLTGK